MLLNTFPLLTVCCWYTYWRIAQYRTSIQGCKCNRRRNDCEFERIPRIQKKSNVLLWLNGWGAL